MIFALYIYRPDQAERLPVLDLAADQSLIRPCRVLQDGHPVFTFAGVYDLPQERLAYPMLERYLVTPRDRRYLYGDAGMIVIDEQSLRWVRRANTDSEIRAARILIDRKP